MPDDGDLFDEGGSESTTEAAPQVDLSAELLHALLFDKGAVNLIHESGLHRDLIPDAAARDAYQEILTHYARHGEPMTEARFRKRFKDITVGVAHRPEIVDLILDVQLAAKHRHLAEHLQTAMQIISGNTGNKDREEDLEKIYDSAHNLLKQRAEWFTPPGDRVQTFGDGQDLILRYENKQKGILSGIPMYGPLFKDLAEDLGPLEPGHLTGLFGRPGTKKTFLMILLAVYCALKGVRTFLWSSEMEPIELKERGLAMFLELSYTLLVRAKLDQSQEAKFRAFMTSENCAKLNEFLFIAGPTSAKTMEDIEIYCIDNKIKMACLDNVHTMESRGEKHLKIDNLMFDMKYMALRRRLPVVYSTHQNRYGGSGMEGVAYGDAFNTWSSNMINLKKVDDRKIQAKTIKVRSGIGDRQYLLTVNLDCSSAPRAGSGSSTNFMSIRMNHSSTGSVVIPRQEGNIKADL